MMFYGRLHAANQASTLQYYDSINADGRGRIDSYLSVLYNYYKYIEQRDMTQEKYKYLAYAYETRMPEVAGKDYPLATLLYTPDAAKNVGLSNQNHFRRNIGVDGNGGRLGYDQLKLDGGIESAGI